MPRRARVSEVLVPIERGKGVPLRIQLQRALRKAIQEGRLFPGALLPSSRVFAEELGLARGVVVDAYEQLAAEGYLISRRGSATLVAHRAATSLSAAHEPELPAEPRYDFRPGRPDHSLFPRGAWLACLRRVLATAPDAAFDYPDARGARQARAAVAGYVNRSRATAATPDRTLLCAGFAQGMRLVCEVLKTRGVRRIAVEDPGHAFESSEVRASGLELVPVPVDDRGICVDRLARLKVGAVYVTPAHQYPTGAVLSSERRASLLAWAAEQRGLIVEDDYDGEYRYDREPIGALQGLGPELVVYIGSASKILAPALRMGWILSPQTLIQDLSRAKLDADRGSAGMDQLALAEFIERGYLDRHLRRTRLIYSRRRAQLATALGMYLPECRIRGIAAGLHLTLELPPEGAAESKIIAGALRRGIHIHGMRTYQARAGSGKPALLVGYCRLPEEKIKEGAKALAAAIRAVRRPAGP
jgi:GntR family transcriptional regulator / MocR family aminotransferase